MKQRRMITSLGSTSGPKGAALDIVNTATRVPSRTPGWNPTLAEPLHEPSLESRILAIIAEGLYRKRNEILAKRVFAKIRDAFPQRSRCSGATARDSLSTPVPTVTCLSLGPEKLAIAGVFRILTIRRKKLGRAWEKQTLSSGVGQ